MATLIERLRNIDLMDDYARTEGADEIERLRDEWETANRLKNEYRREVAEAVAAERERCAKIAETWKSPLRPGTEARRLGHEEAAREIAADIRANEQSPIGENRK